MVDTRDLKSLGSNAVRVRVPPRACFQVRSNVFRRLTRLLTPLSHTWKHARCPGDFVTISCCERERAQDSIAREFVIGDK